MRHLACLIALFTVSACTSISVQPVDPDLQVRHVCIQDNPKVIIDGFVEYLQDDFQRHGITTEVIGTQRPRQCEYILSYTARRSWDIATYMSTASVSLTRDGRSIASANYRLKGKGGLALTKFKGTESKLDDIVDELLAGYQVEPDATVARVEDDSVFSANVDAELQQLEALRGRGIITDEEFEQEKRLLLDSN
jgi:hypothetical protein